MDINVALGVGIGFGLAVIGAGIGQGLTASAAVTGMSRQPEAAGKIQIAMLLGMAPHRVSLYSYLAYPRWRS